MLTLDRFDAVLARDNPIDPWQRFEVSCHHDDSQMSQRLVTRRLPMWCVTPALGVPRWPELWCWLADHRLERQVWADLEVMQARPQDR